MSKIIGIDLGNSAIKIATENLHTIIPTFIAPGIDLREISFDEKHYKKDQLLDVFVSSPSNEVNGRFFVGKLAYNESRTRLIERNSLAPKSEDNVLLITGITAIAFHLLSENPNTSTEYIKLYVSMPVEEYFALKKDYKKILIDRLKTTHIVEFKEKTFNNAKVKLIVEDVKIIPEGAGAFYSFLKDENSIKKNRLLIDIGRYTTDILYFENGEFQKSGFIGLDEGTATPIGEIQKYLQNNFGYNYSYFQIDNALRNNKKIKGRGKIIDLTEIADNAFNNFSMLINSKISEKVKQNAIDLNNADDVLLAGGGAILMSNYINIENLANGLEIIYSENPIMANAIGNLMLGKAQNEEELKDDEEIEEKNIEKFEEIEDDVI
jgi:hypothetical protein